MTKVVLKSLRLLKDKPFAYWRIDLWSCSQNMEKQRVPCDCIAADSGNRDTIYLFFHSLLSRKCDWSRFRTPCYRKENPYCSYSVSVITDYHHQFTILLALRRSSLSLLKEIMFLFVINKLK